MLAPAARVLVVVYYLLRKLLLRRTCLAIRSPTQRSARHALQQNRITASGFDAPAASRPRQAAQGWLSVRPPPERLQPFHQLLPTPGCKRASLPCRTRLASRARRLCLCRVDTAQYRIDLALERPLALHEGEGEEKLRNYGERPRGRERAGTKAGGKKAEERGGGEQAEGKGGQEREKGGSRKGKNFAKALFIEMKHTGAQQKDELGINYLRGSWPDENTTTTWSHTFYTIHKCNFTTTSKLLSQTVKPTDSARNIRA